MNTQAQAVDEIDNKLDNLHINSKSYDKKDNKFDNGIFIERNEVNQFNRAFLPQVNS